MGIKKLHVSLRPREKAYQAGIDKLSDIELIAILLSYGTKKNDVLEISYQLLKKYGSLSALFSSSMPSLMENDGIKIAKAVKLIAVKEISRRLEREKYLSKKITMFQAASIFRSLFINDYQEHVAIIVLDGNDNLLYFSSIQDGNDDSVILVPKYIASICLSYHGRKIYLSHNHPSDNVVGSIKDVEETKNLRVMLNMLGITLIDHLIIGRNKFYSLLKQSCY